MDRCDLEPGYGLFQGLTRLRPLLRGDPSLRFGWSKRPWLPEYVAENVLLHPERLDRPLCRSLAPA